MAEKATTGFVRSADPFSGHDRVKTEEPADNRDNEDKREREYDDEGDHVADLLLVRVVRSNLPRSPRRHGKPIGLGEPLTTLQNAR